MQKGWNPLVLGVIILFLSGAAYGWSNGGKSDDPLHPKYGTHDWISEHALDLLPQSEKYFITDNMAAYLYGTEIPDFVYYDTENHHIYFYPNGTCMEDDAAVKAMTHYQALKDALKSKELKKAAEEAGIMSHYMADVSAFPHVLSAKTAWGEERHHSDFESDVERHTERYNDSFFTVKPDGLVLKDAYNLSIEIAKATTFGDNGAYNARWLDDNYVNSINWSSEYRGRINTLINLAVNNIADAIHSAVVESGTSSTENKSTGFEIPRVTQNDLLLIGVTTGILLIIAVSWKMKRS